MWMWTPCVPTMSMRPWEKVLENGKRKVENGKRKLMRYSLLFAIGLILTLFLPATTHGQALPMDAPTTASLLTCGPGDDFYTTFGHSAIRICCPQEGIDKVYNYGTFDFNTPHFYWKFMCGRLDYQLGRTTFDHFMAEYRYEGRWVKEEPLNLTPQQVNNLYILLETNYLPEYRYYRYDFFANNCATRVRDIIYSASGADTVLYRQTPSQSYRRLVAEPLKGTMEWWRLGIDILLGLPVDHHCTAPERMFLPLEMSAEMAQGEWSSSTGNKPLVDKGHMLLAADREATPRSFPPLVVFSLLLVAVALLSLNGRRIAWLDRTLFIIAGTLGLFLVFMWAGTDHLCTARNLNLLWASPLLLLIAIRLDRSPHWALWLQEGAFAVAAVWVIWCGLSPALLPIILTLALCTAKQMKNEE